jgi:hypothetical protein
MMASIRTTLGPKTAAELGFILPHEHVFVDLRTWDTPGYAEANVDEVIQLMAPELERARDAGVTAIIECSTVGVGRISIEPCRRRPVCPWRSPPVFIANPGSRIGSTRQAKPA